MRNEYEKIIKSNNGRYNFVIKDVANFTTNYSVTISNIDRDGPVITPTISTTSWTKGNVNINLKLSDSKSGFNYVVLPNGNISYSTEVNYLLTENKKVTFVAYDKVGNTTTYTVNVTNIDKTAPTYTKAEILNKNKYGYDVYIYGVADNNGGSGINRVQFPTWTSKNGQDDLDSNWANSTTSRGTNLGNGIWKFHVNTADHNTEYGEYITHIYIYDNVGNYSMTSVSIVIDNTPPVLDLSIDYDLYTTDPVTITAIATDDCTGVHRIVKPDGSVVYGDNTTYVVKKNGLYTFKCYDEANNETIKTIEIKNIIDVEPCSGLKSVEYRLSGDTVTSDWVDYTGTFGILNEGITYIEARAFDNAGNVSYDNSVAKIDRTKPINGTIEINTTIK